MTEPRLMTGEKAREYLGGVSASTFDRWMREGLIPRPLPGTVMWDRRALDLSLDAAGGLPGNDRRDETVNGWD